ncbi:hypothetical protein DFH29DRAFT_998498 [Suillus ampliporus]|nr:hypothetical protein DFH29DRAFT_998498 [Suillus ampliporus]
MPRIQLHGAGPSNVMTFFVVLLCVSQVYASCISVDPTSCTSSFPKSTTIGLIIGGIVLVTILGIIGRIRRRRLRQRSVLAAYRPGMTIGYGTPSNSYGRSQSNVFRPSPAQTQCPPGPQSLRPAQVNSWNRQGVTPAPSFPQPSHPSPMTHFARTRPPAMPSPTYRSHPNQTPYASPPSSPDSSHLPGRSFPPAPGFSLSHSPHSPPPTRPPVSADPSSVGTQSVTVAPAVYPLPHPRFATPVARSSPPENLEMHPLTVNTDVVNDEPPPAYTPV